MDLWVSLSLSHSLSLCKFGLHNSERSLRTVGLHNFRLPKFGLPLFLSQVPAATSEALPYCWVACCWSSVSGWSEGKGAIVKSILTSGYLSVFDLNLLRKRNTRDQFLLSSLRRFLDCSWRTTKSSAFDPRPNSPRKISVYPVRLGYVRPQSLLIPGLMMTIYDFKACV